MFATPICLVGRGEHRYKQKTPPVVAGAVDARSFIEFVLSAAPPARHVTAMMVMMGPVRGERHEAFSLLHAPKWCQTVAL
jgi:hypothetical protein